MTINTNFFGPRNAAEYWGAQQRDSALNCIPKSKETPASPKDKWTIVGTSNAGMYLVACVVLIGFVAAIATGSWVWAIILGTLLVIH